MANTTNTNRQTVVELAKSLDGCVVPLLMDKNGAYQVGLVTKLDICGGEGVLGRNPNDSGHLKTVKFQWTPSDELFAEIEDWCSATRYPPLRFSVPINLWA